MRTKISGFIETIKDELEHVNRFIYKNPEEAYHEYKAQSILTETLEKYGFRVEKNFLGLGTEFRASFGEGSPAVAFLCEYDALPGIGPVKMIQIRHYFTTWDTAKADVWYWGLLAGLILTFGCGLARHVVRSNKREAARRLERRLGLDDKNVKR